MTIWHWVTISPAIIFIVAVLVAAWRDRGGEGETY